LRGTKALPHRKAVAPALFQTYSFPGIPPVHPFLRFDYSLEFPSLVLLESYLSPVMLFISSTVFAYKIAARLQD